MRKRTLDLMSESQKRQVVRKLLKEELIKFETYQRHCDLIINEERRLISEGYSRVQINEDIGALLKNLGGDFVTYFKRYFIKEFLSKIGLDTESFFGKILVECIKNLEFMEISKYFGDNACVELTDVLLKCSQDFIAGEGIDMFGRFVLGGNFIGAISGTFKEALLRNLKDITQALRDPLTKYFCETVNFSELAAGLKGMFSGASSKLAGLLNE